MNLLEWIERMFEQYGYLVLLIGLPLDFIALPIPPGNSTLTYTGFLTYKGILEIIPAVGSAFIGAALGLTITYMLGFKFGMPLIERYGKWLFIKPSLVEKTQKYYEKYGNKLLVICFFIPGVRQFIGYFLGMIRVPYRMIWIYGYVGVASWIIGFFSIGFIFGDQWQYMLNMVEHYLKVILICFVCSFAILLVWNRVRRHKVEKVAKITKKS
ncbi:DedA family protein [Paenibacillus sp. JCM 10914]|uniref:DedA family protein n=1 Tax=Paenibacillus sp. JCM 10914 TaxID=1236974 RepID=UPI0003CC6EF1|nr:DedA family protein [Paenibacillus sp. JCM 10914]GAE05231.1 alkaline phosphatase like protein [Paenibacillus sp. JCM 10914]